MTMQTDRSPSREAVALQEALTKLATKQPGYGMSYSSNGIQGCAEIRLYGKRAEAAHWLMEHGPDAILALLTPATKGGSSLGLDVDGMCDDHGQFMCRKCVDAYLAHRASPFLTPATQPDAAREAKTATACKFIGVSYTKNELEAAQRAACAIVPFYGTGDHGEQEAAASGRLWNDHPAVQGALRAIFEVRLADPVAASASLEALDRFVTDHSGNDDTNEGLEVEDRAQRALAYIRAMLAFADATRPKVSDARDQVKRAIADGFSDGNEQYDEASEPQRYRYDMAADAVIALRNQPSQAIPDEPVVREIMRPGGRPTFVPDAQASNETALSLNGEAPEIVGNRGVLTEPLPRDTGFAMVGATPVDEQAGLREALEKIAASAPNHCVCCTMMGATARAALAAPHPIARAEGEA